MTGQGGTCVDMISELNRLGPNEYISKPWPEKGRTLATVVKNVLLSSAEGHTPKPAGAAPKAKTKFDGGTIVYLPERIEILGHMITEKSHRGNFWNVLQCLRQKNAEGQFKGFSGRALGSQFKNGGASQNTVASCVGDLRERLTAVLAEAGVEAGEQDIILSGGPGYRFNEWITVVEGANPIPASPQAPAPAVPTTTAPLDGPDAPLSDRQLWVLDKLRTRQKLQRVDLERQFDITDKTAKRDLSDMIHRGLAVFVRIPRPGHYEIAKRTPGSNASD